MLLSFWFDRGTVPASMRNKENLARTSDLVQTLQCTETWFKHTITHTLHTSYRHGNYKPSQNNRAESDLSSVSVCLSVCLSKCQSNRVLSH